jgi:hypothetical protein
MIPVGYNLRSLLERRLARSALSTLSCRHALARPLILVSPTGFEAPTEVKERMKPIT